MVSPSNRIRVPKPAKSSYNPERLLAKNTLLLNQIKHFYSLEQKLAPEHRSGMDFAKVLTEGQAAEYIHKMTKILHTKTKTSGGK